MVNLSLVFTKKTTFSGFFTNYVSLIPMYEERGLLYTLRVRSFSICYDFIRFHLEINQFKAIFRKNNYLPNFIEFCIKSLLN